MSRLDEALDYWSLDSQLNKIMEYQWNYQGNSQYYDHYIDQINELSNIAGDMINELVRTVEHIGRDLPWKDVEFYTDDASNTGVSWFNTALAMIDDIDMAILLTNEDIDDDNEIKQKNKRLKAIDKLTKAQIKSLLGLTFDYIYRYLKLKAGFETILAVIDELDYHQSAVKTKDGEMILNNAAWLA